MKIGLDIPDVITASASNFGKGLNAVSGTKKLFESIMGDDPSLKKLYTDKFEINQD